MPLPIQQDVVDAKKVEKVDPLNELYKLGTQQNLDLGDFNSFSKDMNRKEARTELYQLLSPHYDLGEFDDYEQVLDPYIEKGFIDKTIDASEELGKSVIDAVQKEGLLGAGVSAITAPFGETGVKVKERLVEPLLHLRKALPEEPPPDFFGPVFGMNLPTGFRRTMWGIQKGVADIVDSFSSPINIGLTIATAGTRAAPMLLQRLIPAIFTVDMAMQVPNIAKDFKTAVERGDSDLAIELATIGLFMVGTTGLLAKETMGRFRRAPEVDATEVKSFADDIRVSLQDKDLVAKLEAGMKDRREVIEQIWRQSSEEQALRDVLRDSDIIIDPTLKIISKEGRDVSLRAQAIEAQLKEREFTFLEKEKRKAAIRKKLGFKIKGVNKTASEIAKELGIKKVRGEGAEVPKKTKPRITEEAVVPAEGLPIKEYVKEVAELGNTKKVKELLKKDLKKKPSKTVKTTEDSGKPKSKVGMARVKEELKQKKQGFLEIIPEEGTNKTVFENTRAAFKFLAQKFPRLMANIDKIVIMKEQEFIKKYKGLDAGDRNRNAVLEATFDSDGNRTSNFVMFMRDKNFKRYPDVGVSPQKAGTTKLERASKILNEEIASIETIVDMISHEAAHGRDFTRFGPAGFAVLKELGGLPSKELLKRRGVKSFPELIEQKIKRQQERGPLPQRYLDMLSERRARAQGRTALRRYKESLKDDTNSIREAHGVEDQVPRFSEFNYNKVRHILKRSWEHHKEAGLDFSEFTSAMHEELGENIDDYIKRFMDELIAQGLTTEVNPNIPNLEEKEGEMNRFKADKIPLDADPEQKLSSHAKEVENLEKHNVRWNKTLADLFSVERRGRVIGSEKTFLKAKNFFGVELRWQMEGLKVAKRQAASVRRGIKPTSSDLQYMALMAEDKAGRVKMSPEQKARLGSGLKLWDDFYSRVLKAYEALDSEYNPREILLQEFSSEAAKWENKGVNVDIIRKAAPIIKGLKFVTPEAGLWLENLVRKDIAAAAAALLKLKRSALKESSIGVDVEVTQLSFKKLLEAGVSPDEINMVDVTAMLGRRAGLDIATLDLLKTAVEDGIARKNRIPNDLFVPAPKQARGFQEYRVHPALHEWLQRMTTADNRLLKGLDKGISLIKMAAFYNPLFLPMYDIYQAGMAGAIKPQMTGALLGGAVGGLPGAAAGFVLGDVLTSATLRLMKRPDRSLYAGFLHTIKQTDVYYGAINNGMSSVPFPNFFESFEASANHIKNVLAPEYGQLTASALGHGIELVKAIRGDVLFENVRKSYRNGDRVFKILKNAIPTQTIENFYNMSWGTAWMLDRSVRMSTYLYLRNKGFSSVKAAQLAALYHGDYASVPMETRKMLNRIFFTPTFKIAMAKLQTKMVASAIRGVGKHPIKGTVDIMRSAFGAKNVKTLSPRQAQLASSLFYTGALLLGYHLFMKANGFETEEFAVKYKRRTITDEGLKDIIVSHSTPANLFLKYWNRASSVFDAGPTSAAKGLVNRFKWEITPALRVANNLIENKDDSGDSIYLNTDAPISKLGKSVKYALFNSIQMLGLIGSDEEQVEARKKLAEETSQLFQVATSPFVFSYLKDPEFLIGQAKINRIISKFRQDVKEGRIAPQEVGAHADRLAKQIDEIVEDSIQRE